MLNPLSLQSLLLPSQWRVTWLPPQGLVFSSPAMLSARSASTSPGFGEVVKHAWTHGWTCWGTSHCKCSLLLQRIQAGIPALLQMKEGRQQSGCFWQWKVRSVCPDMSTRTCIAVPFRWLLLCHISKEKDSNPNTAFSNLEASPKMSPSSFPPFPTITYLNTSKLC